MRWLGEKPFADADGGSKTGLGAMVLVVALAVTGCSFGGGHRATTQGSDPPLLVPWSRIGDIALGESRARVRQEYGSQKGYPQPYYRLHGGKVWVTFDGRRVSDLGFTTPYYRTKRGFGVGSRIPLGPCHRTATDPCAHYWHGFIWNAWVKETPCGCWVKVGIGERSLAASSDNFLKPWFFIYINDGRVTEISFVSKFID